MPHILIAGCGKLGAPLGLQLASDGQVVTGIKRRLTENDHTDINWLAMDITQPDQYHQLPSGIDALIIILTPAERSAEGYKTVYQDGINHLLMHYDSQDTKPWVLFVSATSVYGQQNGEWVDETSVTRPEQYNGQSLLAAEQAVLGFNPNSVIVRFSGIYGAARSRVIKKLESPQRIQQSPPVYSNRIHQDDCIAVLYFLICEKLADNALDNIYLATDFDCAEKFEVMSWLANRTGLIPPTPEIASVNAPQNKRCSNKRLVARGFHFKYASFRDGYAAMLQSANAKQ